jgi:hypothetical protein
MIGEAKRGTPGRESGVGTETACPKRGWLPYSWARTVGKAQETNSADPRRKPPTEWPLVLPKPSHSYGIQYIGDFTLEGRKGLEATRNAEIGGLRSFGIPFAISFVQLRSIEVVEVI